MEMLPLGVLSTGSYLPRREVSNEQVASRCGVSPEWIERKTGILTRRYAAPEEATSDLAVHAARAALDQAGMSVDRIRYIIVSTSTGDHPQPPTSCLVQDALQAYGAACFDINVVCAGFVYALHLARALITVRPDAYALVISADLYSRILDFSDRRTAVLLGDGAGAAVVGQVPPTYGILGIDLASYGDRHRLIRVDAGGSRLPASPETVQNGGHFFRMDGRGVRDFVMDLVPPSLAQLTSRVGVRLEDVHHFVPHQANGVLLKELTDRAGLAHANMPQTVERFGNVGSASISIALDTMNCAGELSDGELVLLAGFGGGMSVGTCLLRWVAPGQQ